MPRRETTVLAVAVALVGAGCGSRGQARAAPPAQAAQAAHAQAAQAAPLKGGDLDPSFSQDGLMTRDIFGHSDNAVAITIGRGGTVLVGGTAGLSDLGLKAREVVLRFRDDGSRDPGFGQRGLVRTALGQLNDMLELPDGKLLVVGDAKGSAAVARLLPDGTSDPTWGRNGLSVIPRRAFGGSGCIDASAFAVMDDGRLVVGGGLGCGGKNGVFAARLRPNGALDRRFAQHGAWVSHSSCNVVGVAVQRTGKILVGGSTGREGNEEDCAFGSMLLTRLRQDGTPDATFATNGRLRVGFPGARHSKAAAFQVDERARVLLVGTAGGRFAVARVLPSGRLDRSFSGDGLVRSRGRGDASATGVAVSPDGQITISGQDLVFADSGDDLGSRFDVLRFEANGGTIRSFGPHGVKTISFGFEFERASDVAIDAAGRTVVVGFTQTNRGDNDFAIARLG